MKRKGNSRIKILVIIRWPVGGIRSFIKYTYNNLPDSNKYQFIFLCPDSDEKTDLINDLKKLDTVFISIDAKFHFLHVQKALLRIIHLYEIDMVHSHGLMAGIYASVISKLFRLPHIISVHELLYEDQFSNSIKGIVLYKLLAFFFALVDVIHLVSKDAKDNLLKFFPKLTKSKAKIISIMNGVDSDRFISSSVRNFREELKLSEDTFLIGFLGRFMPVKGFRFLLDALEIIVKKSNAIKKKPILLTFGWGSFIREEMEKAKKKGLSRYIITLPFVANVAQSLRGLDVVVMPSLAEACGILAMEAMISGVPVIGTSCEGLREVLDGTPSVAVPPADSEALAIAISNEIKNSSRIKAESFKEQAALRFDIKKQAKKIDSVISDLLKKKCRQL